MRMPFWEQSCSSVLASLLLPGLEPGAARWRDVLAGKRVLLVLDDAAGLGRVEPLLPGAAGSTGLVISRCQLGARCDASVLSLDIFAPSAAMTPALFLDASTVPGRRQLGPY